MALSLKMLPCKKRRAAAGPQSPRDDGELPGGSSSAAGAADGGSSAKLAARAGAPPSSGPGVWRGPGEASLKGGKRPVARAAPGCAQEAPGTKEACAQLPEGLGAPEAAAEGKGGRSVSRGVGGSPHAIAPASAL